MHALNHNLNADISYVNTHCGVFMQLLVSSLQGP
jgi:hypothetical protein